jgi:hypothetical protein
MGHYVKIAPGAAQVSLPDGGLYDAGDIVLLTDDQYADLTVDGDPLIDMGEDRVGAQILSIPVTFAAVPAGAGDVVTNFTLEGSGTISAFALLVTTAGAGAGATRAFNLEIGTTNVTGGVITATLAGTATVGTVVNSTAITAANTFNDGDTLSIEVAAGTVFTGGEGVFLITVT